MTGIDPWFLDQIQQIVDLEKTLGAGHLRGRRDPPRGQAHGLLRRAPRAARRGQRGRGPRGPQGAGDRAGLQARRHLRRGVRVPHPVPLLDLRAGVRGGAHRPAEDRDPRQRPQPDRAGHRVRLLLLPRLLRLQGGGVRDHHGQLQPRDGLDRLRHLRPALLRAADLRGRDERHREGEARRGRHPVRRADPAAAGPASPGGGGADHRDQPRRHRPRRGPKALQRSAPRARHPPARERHRDLARGGQGGGRPHRLPGPGPARPTSSAGGPWPSSTTPPTSRATCARR